MIGDADVISIKRKKKMTKKPKLELYPIKRVQVWSNGRAKETYWVVQKPDGTEIQCSSYQMAEKIQQENKLDKKEKV